MKIAPLLLASLITVRAAAQIIEPNELTYGPFEPGPREHSFAIGIAPHGMLLVWSEVDQETRRAAIHTGLLNFDAQLIGPINKLPAARTFLHNTTPAVTTDGKSFFVAWVDRHPYYHTPTRVSGLQTDLLGAATEGPRIFGDSYAGSTPSLVWDGISYRLHADGHRRVPFANGQANGFVDWFPIVPEKICPTCGPPFAHSEPAYRLDWGILSHKWLRSGRFTDTGYTGVAPAVAADGHDLLIVWTTPKGLSGLRVTDGVEGKQFKAGYPINPETSPAISGSLVVYENDGDIYGSMVEGDTFGEPFPISTGRDRDTLPKVYGFGNGRYLVAYVREHFASWVSLVGRFVTTEP